MTVIRRARPEDREYVLRFTQQTFQWGDYISEVFDDWVVDEHGRLLVAEIDRRVVGILHLGIVTQREGWLEGMRIDREFRNRGLASLLTEAATEMAMSAGLSVLRMAIGSDNVSSQSLARKLGFRQVMAFRTLTIAPLPAGEVNGVRRARMSDLVVILRLVRASSSGGLGFFSWECVTIDEELLKKNIEAGLVLVCERPGDGIVACGFIMDDHPHGVEVAMSCGEPGGIGRILEAGRRLAGESDYANAISTNVLSGPEEAVALAQGWVDYVEEDDTEEAAHIELLFEKKLPA